MYKWIVNLASRLRRDIVMDAAPGPLKRNMGNVTVAVCNAIIYGESPWSAFKRSLRSNRKTARYLVSGTVLVAIVYSAGLMTNTGLYKAASMKIAYLERSLGITRANLKGTEADKDVYMAKLDSVLLHKDYMRFVVLRDAGVYVPDDVPKEDLKKMFAAADEFKVPYGIYFRLVNKESAFNPNAVSPKGARGYTQIMPEYYQYLLAKAGDKKDDVTNSARITGYMLRTMFNEYVKGNSSREAWKLSLAAYNAGSGAVSAHGGIPPYNETITYVNYIITGLK